MALSSPLSLAPPASGPSLLIILNFNHRGTENTENTFTKRIAGLVGGHRGGLPAVTSTASIPQQESALCSPCLRGEELSGDCPASCIIRPTCPTTFMLRSTWHHSPEHAGKDLSTTARSQSRTKGGNGLARWLPRGIFPRPFDPACAQWDIISATTCMEWRIRLRPFHPTPARILASAAFHPTQAEDQSARRPV